MNKCENQTGEAILGEEAEHYASHKKWAGLMFSGPVKTIGGLKQQGQFLEMGAGPGFMAVMLAKKHPGITLTLVDLSPDMAKAATEYIHESGMARRIRYLVGDAGDAVFLNGLGAYDCVYTTFSLHHWKDKETSLNNLWQAVAPGGIMVIHDFRRIDWLGSLAGSGGMGKSIRSSFKPEEMKTMLQKIGAANIRVKALPWSPFQTVIAKKSL